MKRRITVLVYMVLVLLTGGGLALAQTATVAPGDLRATASALQTQAAQQENAEGTAQAQATAQVTDKRVTPEGKPLTGEQIKTSDELWAKVQTDSGVLKLTIEGACGNPAIRIRIAHLIADGNTPAQAWQELGRSDDIGWRIATQNMLFDVVAAMAVSTPPTGMTNHIPTYFEVVSQVDAVSPGCSTGQPIK